MEKTKYDHELENQPLGILPSQWIHCSKSSDCGSMDEQSKQKPRVEEFKLSLGYRRGE